MSLFPMFVKLEGRSCLVVGAGTVGEPKIRSLLDASASVRVIAPRTTSVVAGWAQAGTITWGAREVNTSDLDGGFLVIAATSSCGVTEAIFLDEQRRYD